MRGHVPMFVWCFWPFEKPECVQIFISSSFCYGIMRTDHINITAFSVPPLLPANFHFPFGFPNRKMFSYEILFILLDFWLFFSHVFVYLTAMFFLLPAHSISFSFRWEMLRYSGARPISFYLFQFSRKFTWGKRIKLKPPWKFGRWKCQILYEMWYFNWMSTTRK